MLVQRLTLKNWRNFRELDIPLREHTYLLGANATGKSNLLDAFRFLRDISKSQGGGLQKAIGDRGGIQKLRCLHARRTSDVAIDIHLAEAADDPSPVWRYQLAFKPEGKGAQRILITSEKVWRGSDSTPILDRPNSDDIGDPARLTQTHLQQIEANSEFRAIADFLSETVYLHIVPQLLKYGDQIGGHRLENDPFGQGLLDVMARVSKRSRESRLNKIQTALALAIPQFSKLRFVHDEINGHPHLEALYAHHRPNAGWQREDQFSDGTLRLLALLWSLLDGAGLLLLEAPELSLNDSIVSQIPMMLQRVQRNNKKRRQVLISTHSDALLNNPGIDGRGIIMLEAGAEGSTARTVNSDEAAALRAGLSVAEVILPKTRKETTEQLRFW